MEKFKQHQTDKSEGNNNSYHKELMRYHHASVYDYQPGSEEEQRLLDWERSYAKKEEKINKYKVEMGGSEEGLGEIQVAESVERIKEILTCIDSVTLEPEYVHDPEQVKLLQLKKQQAKELIQDLLQRDVVEYVSCVREYNKARVDVQQQSMDIDTFISYDNRRTIKHNALIDRIRIVSRFIRNNFGELTDEELDDYEEQLESRGETYLHVQRIVLPRNVICPDYINLTIREEITDWALDIHRSLAELPV